MQDQGVAIRIGETGNVTHRCFHRLKDKRGARRAQAGDGFFEILDFERDAPAARRRLERHRPAPMASVPPATSYSTQPMPSFS